MERNLYCRLPGERRAQICAITDSLHEEQIAVENAAFELGDNTILFVRNGMGGTVWISRDGDPIRIWKSQGARSKGITMAQAMAAAPNMTTKELHENFDTR